LYPKSIKYKTMKTISIFLTTLILTVMTTVSAQTKSISKIYVFESDGNGFNTKTVFYDDGKEVVAFDAQFTESFAQQAIDFLKTKTSNPIKYLVITHPNPDKFNGIPAFKNAGAKVIMSKASATNMEAVHNYKKYYFVEMAKMFTNDTYPKLPSADITFDDRYEIKLANGGLVVLNELKQSGIATNQTLAYIKSLSALVVGDLVHHKAHAWLEGPIVNGNATYNVTNWISVLKKIQKKYPSNVMVYGGRGETGKLSDVIPQQITYLQVAEKITREYLLSISNDKAKVDYAQLQKIFETSFTSYALGYMINYGAYGIVASIK
jgi:glyoxylase-like metal-dependent hydrolase (beta-lactamase superfamily II)